MNLLRWLGCSSVMVWVLGASIAGCSKTESLGSGGEAQNGEDGGDPDASGGSVNGTGGRQPGSGGRTGSGGGGSGGASGGTKATGGTGASGGTAGSGGNGGGDGGIGGNGSGGAAHCEAVDCRTDQPTSCNEGEELVTTFNGCCTACVPRVFPPAACIIGGVRYEHLEVVKREAGQTCLCVDGHIGRCTGVTGVDDAGADLPLPKCPEGQDLIESCAECTLDAACSAWRFECRRVGGCNNDTVFCGAEDTCYKGACIPGAEMCL